MCVQKEGKKIPPETVERCIFYLFFFFHYLLLIRSDNSFQSSGPNVHARRLPPATPNDRHRRNWSQKDVIITI